jgi:hypothetical protein
MSRVLAASLLPAAAFAAVLAWATHFVSCLDGTGSMCPDGRPTTTVTLQLVLGLLDVASAGAAFYLTLRGRPRAAGWAIAAGLLTFAVWAVLNDAAVHGWGHEMRFW